METPKPYTRKTADQSDEYMDRLSFIGQWYDFETYHMKNFYVNFYTFDSSVELFDIDRDRMYLRRAACEGVSIKDMFVGNTVRIYGRQIKLLNYGDNKTRKLISKKCEKTFLLIKPTVLKDMGTIFSILYEQQFKVLRLKMCRLTHPQALEFYDYRKNDSFFPFLIEHIESGRIVAIELVGENAIERLVKMVGPDDPHEARKDAPDSLRARFGVERVSNGFHPSVDEEQVLREINYFFPKKITDESPMGKPEFNNSTCCIIKPHAIESGDLGPIISFIYSKGYKVTAMELFYLSNSNTDEFLEVYKGIVNNFHELVLSFIDGPLIAMEISGNDNVQVQSTFRNCAGPVDPDIAKQIRPDTLRAKFGIDKYKNAVHCTDLPEDAMLELEYFFRILQN